MLKIAINAGHGLSTAGKRCMTSLDPNETREWVLNSRIVDKVEDKLAAYQGFELLRIDDKTGAKDISLSTRVGKANTWGADIWVSVHHNAGVKGGKGGGIVVYTYTKVDQTTKDWQKALYNNLIKHTGLKGNRATPLASANFYECRKTKMPAVLMELGFMDSATDTPIILTEAYAEKCADAIVETIVQKGGLSKKPAAATPSKLYRVQVGAYAVKANAENMQKRLKAAGFDAIIV